MNNNGKYIECLAIFNTYNIHEQIILKNKQGMKLYEEQLNVNTLIIRAAHNTVLIQKKSRRDMFQRNSALGIFWSG
jgi:hypothetical protein